MPSCPCDEQSPQNRTRVEASLLKLYRAVERKPGHDETVDSLFAQWQNRWASQRNEIVRRLEAIDSQLDGLYEPTESTPRFAVIGPNDDAAQF